MRDVRSYAHSRSESVWCTNPVKRAPVPAAVPQPSRRSARDAAIRDILETSITVQALRQWDIAKPAAQRKVMVHRPKEAYQVTL